MSSVHQHARGVSAVAAVAAALIVLAAFAGAALAVPGTVTGVSSPTHPSETTWYSSPNPSFVWEPALADGSAISGYSCVLDRSLSTIPDTISDRNSLTYLPRVTYAVGSRPAEARIVDVSGDGKPDLVVENYNSNTVSVLIGHGDGTLAPKVDYATAAGPWSMAIGDVNGDGKIDVVTGNYGASAASVFINKGDGTFTPRADYTTGSGTNPECLRMGDVNGDGALDIVTANASTNNVGILLNNGDGTFKAPVTFSTPVHPTSIDLCDLNGDGKQDLATANYSAGSVSVLMGNGDGTFQAAVNYAVSGNPQMVLAADLDRDGKPDLATVNWGSNNASILLNNGDGTFKPKTDYALGNGPFSFSVIDLNQDSAPDLVTTNYSASSVSILYGNGDGTFDPKKDLTCGSGPNFVALGDLDGDGYGDLITTDMNDNTVSVFRGTAFLGASYAGKADGVWYFHVRAVNSSGVGGPTTTREVRIDATAPATSDGSDPALAADGDSAWCQTGQTVKLEAADASSGLAHTYYTLDGVQHDYDGPFTVTGDGSHALTYWSTDVAGNTESAHSGWVNIDGDAPRSSDASSPALALDCLSGWRNAAQLVTLSAADEGAGPVSGLARVEYDLDGAGYVPYTAPFVVAGEGSHTLRYRAVDEAGNVETAHEAFVNIDLTAPGISSSADADVSWHNGDVAVALAPSDAGGSGVATVQYRLDGGAWKDVSGGIVTVPAAGVNGTVACEYRAVDAAGNEASGGCSIRFDTTGPATSDASDPALAADVDSAWRQTGQTVTLTAADAGGSGLDRTFYTLDGVQHDYVGPFPVSGDGSHQITWWSTDVAGNVETAQSGWVNVWGTPPATSANAVVAASATDGWRTDGAQPVSLTATGGHGATTIHYAVDGGAPTEVLGATADFTVSGDGSHVVEYWSTDELGNEESHRTGYVNIDATVPTTSDDYAGGDVWQTGPVSFSLTATDATSGVAGTTYAIDGGEPQSGSEVVLAADGEHTVAYFSTDNAGNAGDARSVTVRIDAGAPQTSHDAPAGWRNADTTVTLTPADAFSGTAGGLAGTSWELDGGATQAGTNVLVAAPSDHSGDGARTITYRSTDAAGNREADETATVLVDTLAPQTSDDIAAGPPAHTDPVTVTLSASDENGGIDVSGVATTHYRVDEGPWQTGTSVEVSGDGQHTVSYYSTDNAGNDEAVRTSETLTIGTTPPGASSDDAPSGWVDHAVTVTLTPGARAVRTTWELDGGATNTGTSVTVDAPTTHAGDGVHVITYRSWTIGEIAEVTRTAIVRIDTKAPQTTDDAPAAWQRGPVTLTLAATDTSSGVAQTTWSLDGGAQHLGTSVPVSGDGVHTVTYSSSDNAGNPESARTATVRLDGSAPQVSCAAAGRWFRTRTVTATIVASDPESGLAEVTYRIGVGAWQPGTTVLISGAGRHAVSYRATDACGNVTSGSCVVGIDTARPKTTKALASKGRKSGKLTLRFKVTDPRPSCGAAAVNKIVVTTAKGRKVATIKGVTTVVRTNAKVKLVVKKRLRKGSYRFKVFVTDIAGNRGRKAIAGKLTVR
jgi:hypothetical protein